MADKETISYGTSWCPQTARARKFLDECGIHFRWCDIEEDPEGCAFVEQVNRWNRSVPTIVLPVGSILVEPSYDELERKIGPPNDGR